MIHATTHRPHQLPTEPSEEEIQKRAYLLWREEGCPTGRDLDIWLRAKELARHHAAERPSVPARRRRRA